MLAGFAVVQRTYLYWISLVYYGGDSINVLVCPNK